MVCENGICKGIEITENCHKHEDCDATRFCKRANQWPYMNECAKMRTSYEQCIETDECLPSQYCSFASDSDKVAKPRPLRKCLPKYSQDVGTEFGWESISGNSWKDPTYEDLKYNGQYCMSGLAFPKTEIMAVCTTVHKVMFDGKTLWDKEIDKL